VRERVAGGAELLEEAAGHRDVEAAEVGGERLDVDALHMPDRRRRHHIRDDELARTRFFRKNCTRQGKGGRGELRSRSTNRRHDGAHGRRLGGQDLRCDLLRLAL
jgi:hypothetical protein